MNKKRPVQKRTIAIVLLLAILLLAYGAYALGLIGSSYQGGNENTGTDGAPTEEGLADYQATLFYANQAYVETGDESLDHYVTASVTLAIADEENPSIALIDALKKADLDGGTTAVTEQMTVNDCYASLETPGTLVVDMGAQGLSGGSLGEALFIGQVVNTLLSNSDLIGTYEQVQFLVDGQTVESLMGHIDATQPFQADVAF